MMANARDAVKWTLGCIGKLLLPESFENRIIYYHSVHPNLPASLQPQAFREHLRWLRDHGYRTVLVRDVPRLLRLRNEERWVAISFDDGYRDNVEYALPVLLEQECVATFFVVAEMVGECAPRVSDEGFMLYPSRPMLTRSDLVALRDAGMEIGSHGLSHRLACDIEQGRAGAFEEELRASVKKLQEASGSVIASYSYPNGQRGSFSPATRIALGSVGLSVGVTTIWGSVRGSIDLLEAPRCEIASTDNLAEFQAKMCGQRDYLRMIHRIRHGSGVWRSPRALGRAAR